MGPLDVLLHHSEPVDPTLLEWIKTELDHLFGPGEVPIISVIGVLIVVLPLVLSYFAWRRLRRYDKRR
jgi:hypothetical protein